MLTSDLPWWEIVLRTGLVCVVLLLGLRLGGKRQLGQMTPFDLVVILLIANAVQNAMVGPDTSVTGGLGAAGVPLAANAGLARFRSKMPWLRQLVEDDLVVLVRDGAVVARHLPGRGSRPSSWSRPPARPASPASPRCSGGPRGRPHYQHRPPLLGDDPHQAPDEDPSPSLQPPASPS